MAQTAQAQWYARFGIGAHDARRLERALCTLVDFEGSVGDSLQDMGHSRQALHDVCDALRHLIDDAPASGGAGKGDGT